MVANASGAQPKAVDEIFFQNDAVSLRLVINRRLRLMRVIDFRAGATEAKRQCVLSFARREGVEKVYTLVERDEVATWTKLGLAKEGSIPGFYKRSDAFLLGCTVPALGREPRADTGRVDPREDEIPQQSETRLIAASPFASPPATVAQGLMDRTIVAAKRGIKDTSARTTPAA